MISVKSSAEIGRMRAAGQVISRVFELVGRTAKAGMTTLDLDKSVEDLIRESGATPSFKGYVVSESVPPYPASICASVNDEVVHGIPDRRVLAEGDILSVDVGACLDGFHADAARTFAIGRISPEARRLIDVTRESFYRGMAMARAGNRIGDISAAVQRHVEANGYSVVRDLVGHGIGRDLHEAPQIPNFADGRSGPRLAAGMTLAIEPMVNAGGWAVRVAKNGWTILTADGSLSAHYENTVAVTDGEPEILTGGDAAEA
jgi:methionyl aminopeptidase